VNAKSLSLLFLRAVRAWLIATALWITIPSALLYVSWAVYGKRLLTPGEFVHFAGITAFATVAHIGTNGGSRSWKIIAESLSDTPEQIPLTLAGQTYQIPLPPHTIRKSCDRLIAGLPRGFMNEPPRPTIPPSCKGGAEFPTEITSFITTATPEQMDNYIHMTLPAAGWVSDDRLSSFWFFRHRDTRLTMKLTSYLTVSIADFSLTLMPDPAPSNSSDRSTESLTAQHLDLK
jgi:hypothetical protein